MTAAAFTTGVPIRIQEFMEGVYSPGKEIDVSENRGTHTYSVTDGNVSIQTDRFGGCHVIVSDASMEPGTCATIKERVALLADSIERGEGSDSLWVKAPSASRANFLASLTPDNWVVGDPERGNHVQDIQRMLQCNWQWLNPNKPCAIPAGATHNMGATAAILNTLGQIVLVSPQTRDTSWNLPGGSCNPKEALDVTAVREANEECFDEKAELEAIGVVALNIFPNNQFAPAWNPTFVVTAKEGTELPAVTPQGGEIVAAEAFNLDEIIAHDLTQEFHGRWLGNGIQEIAKALKADQYMTKEVDKGWMATYVAKV